jgi:hypothetical protein
MKRKILTEESHSESITDSQDSQDSRESKVLITSKESEENQKKAMDEFAKNLDTFILRHVPRIYMRKLTDPEVANIYKTDSALLTSPRM